MRQNEYYAEKKMKNAKNNEERQEARVMMDRAKEDNRFSEQIRLEIDPIEDAWS
tara:strand:+ start:6084 stop:6245 length:162 start_codon:yes stop_codon:yes gene_type:complete